MPHGGACRAPRACRCVSATPRGTVRGAGVMRVWHQATGRQVGRAAARVTQQAAALSVQMMCICYRGPVSAEAVFHMLRALYASGPWLPLCLQDGQANYLKGTLLVATFFFMSVGFW